MKKYFLLFIFIFFCFFTCLDPGQGNNRSSRETSSSSSLNYIIADHTVVDLYSSIPQYWIDQVKKMWVNIPGESHSSGYRIGCDLLELLDSRFAVNRTESGTPEAYTTTHLRISRSVRTQYSSWSYGTGENIWYTWLAWDTSNPSYPTAAANMIKNHLTYCNTNNLIISAIGFGWCWDMTWTNGPGGEMDPIYGVRWAGSSEGGPDGNQRWGLDADDYNLTGNRVSMETYLNATEQYISYCMQAGYSTKVFFTTGPVDGGGNTGESGYQRHLKHEYIRNHVKQGNNRILFDYADILCWNNQGVQALTTWNGRTYQVIHSDNMMDYVNEASGDFTSVTSHSEDGDHIGEVGALRLAKALWWVLARLAGWMVIFEVSVKKISIIT